MKPRDSMKSKSSTSSSNVPKKNNMFSHKKKTRRNVFDLTGVDGDSVSQMSDMHSSKGDLDIDNSHVQR